MVGTMRAYDGACSIQDVDADEKEGGLAVEGSDEDDEEETEEAAGIDVVEAGGEEGQAEHVVGIGVVVLNVDGVGPHDGEEEDGIDDGAERAGGGKEPIELLLVDAGDDEGDEADDVEGSLFSSENSIGVDEVMGDPLGFADGAHEEDGEDTLLKWKLLLTTEVERQPDEKDGACAIEANELEGCAGIDKEHGGAMSFLCGGHPGPMGQHRGRIRWVRDGIDALSAMGNVCKS